MIAFIFDDRLPHDRKMVFQRTIILLRTQFSIEVLPSNYTEENLLEHLETTQYELVLLPWYKYVSWKKIDAFYGSLRMSGTTVAGYFADAVLPFEFTQAPNYHRFILLDFYRFDQKEIEILVRSLTKPHLRTGLAGLIPQTSPIYTAEWLETNGSHTRCIDDVLALPIFKSKQWTDRRHALRFFLTGLWSYIYSEPKIHPKPIPEAEIELSEFNKKLLIKAIFKNSEYTLKHTMKWMWPNAQDTHPAIKEMVCQSDFVRVQHYPETHQLEITCMFVQSSAAAQYPNELRGFWIEPLKVHHLKKVDALHKRISVQSALAQKKKVA